MDILTFISSIITSIAWPTAVFGVAFLLRGKISELIPLIKKLKYKEFELEFAQALEDIKRKEADLPVQSNSKRLEDLSLLAELSPRAAILESWLAVEVAVLQLGLKSDISSEHVTSSNSGKIAYVLEARSIITKEEANLFKKLRELRNKAVHSQLDRDVSEKSTKEYVESALKLEQAFLFKTNA